MLPELCFILALRKHSSHADDGDGLWRVGRGADRLLLPLRMNLLLAGRD
ncbi:hypothetical protein [Xenorhabdus bovienii]|nr:hypothetical protein [Xenorhabdus bovienii]